MRFSTRRTFFQQVSHDCRLAAGCLLLLLLVLSPWLYGGTRPWTLRLIADGLLTAGSLWLIGAALRGRRALAVPALTGGLLVFLGVWGGWRAWSGAELTLGNALANEAVAWNRFRWPGSFSPRVPIETLRLAVGLLLTIPLAADLARGVRWRRRFLAAMALSGALWAGYGIYQSTTGATAIFNQRIWGDERDVMPGHFFSTYFHHSIAGAQLNLVWPLALGLALGGRKAFFAAAALALAAVLFTVSKAGLAVALLLAGVALWLGKGRWPGGARRRLSLGKKLGLAALAVALAFGAVKFGRAGELVERFALLARETTGGGAREDSRLAGWSVAPAMVAETRGLGFGPGTWTATFPDYAPNRYLRTFWLWQQYAHSDAVQTLVEWGWPGALAWTLVAAGGLRLGLGACSRLRKGGRATERRVTLAAVTLALGGLLLHALFDFPLQVPALQLAACVLLGVLYGSRRARLRARQRVRAPQRSPRSAAPFAAQPT